MNELLLPFHVSVQEWRDYRLTWEAESFDNLSQFVVDSPLIWTPELALINASVF